MDFPLYYVFCLGKISMTTMIASYASLTVHSYIVDNVYYMFIYYTGIKNSQNTVFVTLGTCDVLLEIITVHIW